MTQLVVDIAGNVVCEETIIVPFAKVANAFRVSCRDML